MTKTKQYSTWKPRAIRKAPARRKPEGPDQDDLRNRAREALWIGMGAFRVTGDTGRLELAAGRALMGGVLDVQEIGRVTGLGVTGALDVLSGLAAREAHRPPGRVVTIPDGR